ncbi:MAG: ferritin-like domain-containing protein [Brevinema sp.]
MALQLMKDEVLKEMEAVKCFIDLAIHAQKAGYLKAAEFFLAQAREDCEHAFSYAKTLDKYDEIQGNMTITEIVKKYLTLEKEAIDRVLAIKDQVISEKKEGVMPFVLHILQDHSDEAYTAKKLLQKVSVLDEQQALNDIEELFEELLEK